MKSIHKKLLVLILSCYSNLILLGNYVSYDDYADPEETRFFWEQPFGIIIIIGIIYLWIKSKS